MAQCPRRETGQKEQLLSHILEGIIEQLDRVVDCDFPSKKTISIQ